MIKSFAIFTFHTVLQFILFAGYTVFQFFLTGGESDVLRVALVPLDAVSKLHWKKGMWDMMSLSGLPNNSILPLKTKTEFRLMHH